MPQFQIETQAPLVAFIGIFVMLGGAVLLLFGLGIVQSGAGQDVILKIKSGRQTSVIGLVGIALGAIGILWSVSTSGPEIQDPASTAEPTPITVTDVGSSMYDDFNDPEFNGGVNTNLWEPLVTPPSYIEQQNGAMVLSLEPRAGNEARLLANLHLPANQSLFAESRVLLSGEKPGEDGNVHFGLVTTLDDGQKLQFGCALWRDGLQVGCEAWGRNDVAEYGTPTGTTDYDTWHTVRIEMDSNINVYFYVDGEQIGAYRPPDAEQIKGRSFTPRLQVWSPQQDGLKVYLDDVRVGRIDD
jgi:hypothetical protein